MESNFKDKVVVVTGGSAGIGYATAKEFRENGATVIITGRKKEALDAAAAELGAHPVVADQANVSDIEQLAATVKETYGQVDILFINAGVSGAHLSIEDNTEALFDEVVNVNFKGAYFTLNKFIPVLKDGASVVFLSSVAATGVTPNFSDYSGSKAAVNSIARIAAIELSSRKIRVNIVSPGPTDTGILSKSGMPPEMAEAIAANVLGKLPVGRFAAAGEIAKAVAYLCEPTSTFITGSELLIDGGYAINN